MPGNVPSQRVIQPIAFDRPFEEGLHLAVISSHSRETWLLEIPPLCQGEEPMAASRRAFGYTYFYGGPERLDFGWAMLHSAHLLHLLKLA